MITDNKIKYRYHGNMNVKHNRVEDRDSGVCFMVTLATYTDDQILALWEAQGMDINSYYCCHEHDCCACLFHSAVNIQRFGKRAVASQNFGYNI